MYPIVYEYYRRTLVRRFPYAVFFEYEEGVLTVYGIFHMSRSPRQMAPASSLTHQLFQEVN